jgi:hypothetical protein
MTVLKTQIVQSYFGRKPPDAIITAMLLFADRNPRRKQNGEALIDLHDIALNNYYL